MKIENEKVVSLSYELKLNDANGELVEKADQKNPFVFLFGADNVFARFEEQLNGLSVGSHFEFIISSDEGYGERREDMVVDLPKHLFKGEDGEIDPELLVVGNVIPMMSSDGDHLEGLVLELSDEEVKMDFNHPFAGESLHYKGEVIEIREASAEELSHGHAHGPEGHGAEQ